jgi:hypothetical protein
LYCASCSGLYPCIVAQRLGAARIRHPAFLQHVAVVRGAQGQPGVLFGDEQRQSFLLEPPQRQEDVLHDQGRQAHGRFVQHQQARAAHQGPADRDHLLFAAGQRSRSLAGALGQPREQVQDEVEVAAELGLAALLEQFVAAHFQVFADRQRCEDAPAFGHQHDAAVDDAVGG